MDEKLINTEGTSLLNVEQFALRYNLDIIVDRFQIVDNSIETEYIRIIDKNNNSSDDSLFRLSYLLNVIGAFFLDNPDIYIHDNLKILYIEKIVDSRNYHHKGYIIEKTFFENYLPMNAIEKGEYINNEFKNEVYSIPSSQKSILK